MLSAVEHLATGASMNDRPRIRATIQEKGDTYMVTVLLKERGQTQQIVETTVLSQFEAEAITRLYAAFHNISWNEVEVIPK
jgi:hypothetical protein